MNKRKSSGPSHRMLKPRRQPPKWGDPKRLYRITTDDAEFQLCRVTDSDRNQGEIMVAWQNGWGRWEQAVITKARIVKQEIIEQ